MHKLTKMFNTITVRPGEAFEIALHAEPSTGYSWEFKTHGDAEVEKIATRYTKSDTIKDVPSIARDGNNNARKVMVYGKSIQAIFTFVAGAEEGEAQIIGNYARHWEKGENKSRADSVVFTIKVKSS